MKRFLPPLGLILALMWAASPALALPAFVANLGSATTGANVSSLSVPIGTNCPVGDTLIAYGALVSASTSPTATDTAGNTYSATGIISYTGANYWLVYAPVTVDLPAPTTATGSITTTTATFTTNPGTLIVNQVITGTGVSANTKITGGLSQWNGTTASATVNTSQTVVSETLTVSASVTPSWTTAHSATFNAGCFSGLTSTPLDISGAGVTGTGTSNTIATGTLGSANELIIGVMSTVNSHSAFNANNASTGTFTALSTVSPSGSVWPEWAYQIVSSTSSITFGPSWSTSRVYGVNVWTFQAPSSGNHNMLLLGVGN